MQEGPLRRKQLLVNRNDVPLANHPAQEVGILVAADETPPHDLARQQEFQSCSLRVLPRGLGILLRKLMQLHGFI